MKHESNLLQQIAVKDVEEDCSSSEWRFGFGTQHVRMDALQEERAPSRVEANRKAQASVMLTALAS